MADQKPRPDDDKLQTPGREQNAAQPLDASGNKQGAERYPPVRQDDAVDVTGEDRSFGGNPAPPQGAGDASTPPVSSNEGRLGPAGDPAEGKP
jgi:hypothetical protein